MFAHYSAIQMDGFRTLKPGARVAFDLSEGPKGALACNIHPLEAVASVGAPAPASLERAVEQGTPAPG